jgi:hypothetical protein
MRTLVVSAADEAFAFLLKGLVLSLRECGVAHDIAVLDLGLAEESRAWLAEYDVRALQASWMFTFPESATTPPHLMAIANRPFLPLLFPGYDVYVWLDADTYLQNDEAVRLLIQQAKRVDLAIVPEVDRAYVNIADGGRLRRFSQQLYEQCYYPGIIPAGKDAPAMLNAGVFAMTGSSPIWARWQQEVRAIFRRKPYFFAEQISLNVIAYWGDFRVSLLPARCNWIVGLGRAGLGETGKLMTPCAPMEEISVVHLAGWPEKRRPMDVLDAEGTVHKVSPLYRRGAYLTP